MRRQSAPTPKTLIAPLSLSVILLVGTASLSLAGDPAASSEYHDIYNPARTALVNAQRQLAESSQQEQDILERVRRMDRELDSALKLLADASDLDPSLKVQVEDIRKRLDALKDRPALCPMDNSSSLGTYGQLLDQLQSLIDHY